MSGVYTNLAKKRAEQSKDATLPSPPVQEHPGNNTSSITAPVVKSPRVENKKAPVHSPTPQRIKKQTKNLADGKTQISAVVTFEQKAVILDLESKFNRRYKVVGKGDIAGIGLDVVSRILNRPT